MKKEWLLTIYNSDTELSGTYLVKGNLSEALEAANGTIADTLQNICRDHGSSSAIESFSFLREKDMTGEINTGYYHISYELKSYKVYEELEEPWSYVSKDVTEEDYWKILEEDFGE